jgi:FHA domain-containing protein
MAKLVLFLPDGTTRDFLLTQERMTLGRRPDNDICLSNLAVSGEHAAVVTILADSFLEDLGSTNGTLVNGKPITKHFLRERDEIDVGRHRFIYFAEEDAALAMDIVGAPSRSAAGDLGRMVEKAKPAVRADARTSEATPLASPEQADSVDNTVAVNGDGRMDATARLQANVASSAQAPVAPSSGVALGSIKVIAGGQAGRSIALTKPETTIGRAGVQVALIVQTGATFQLRPVEGEHPPRVNGSIVEAAGVALMPGDAIDIAGSRLEFVRSSSQVE